MGGKVGARIIQPHSRTSHVTIATSTPTRSDPIIAANPTDEIAPLFQPSDPRATLPMKLKTIYDRTIKIRRFKSNLFLPFLKNKNAARWKSHSSLCRSVVCSPFVSLSFPERPKADDSLSPPPSPLSLRDTFSTEGISGALAAIRERREERGGRRRGMEGQTSKISRASSALLRSPTLRSSVHSLAALDAVGSDPEEIKPHSPPPSAAAVAAASTVGSSGHRLAVFSLLLIILLPVPSFFYLRDRSPSLWNLSLASAAVAAASLILKRTRLLLSRRRRSRSDSVRWFIGDGEGDAENPCREVGVKAVREGVEFYSNGDFYEGEFHKGKCSGSGVYNFFGQGRYEGDWVDGKYDGYGIERWARGSRYRGQYRHGLRHGFGVYRFYNGDSYAGEWVGGQSHGRGAQSCSDGSCYVGEFKFGVKHGLGFYHFRYEDDRFLVLE